jgi:molybdenum cofactor cytidylyltransferase
LDLSGLQDLCIPLATALRLDRSARLALVGAGGKTAALFAAGRQLSEKYSCPVLVSCSTHLSLEQAARADRHFVIQSQDEILKQIDASEGVLLFSGPAGQDERILGLDLPQLGQLAALADRLDLPLLVEADGSRRMPLKAPAAHEPAVPPFARQVAVFAGLSGLGSPLDEEHVHRPEHFAALSGHPLGSAVTIHALEGVLRSPQGGLKNVPAHARRIAVLNQADALEDIEQARELAARLLPDYHAALLTTLEPITAGSGQKTGVLWVQEPAAGIVLAAGGAKRFGKPKQVLPWDGQPLVRRAALSALEAGLDPVVVVAGAYPSEVQGAVQDLPVQVVYNPGWEQGQSTSLKAGLTSLPSTVQSAVFLLADQPALSAELIRELLHLHSRTLAPLVAPRVEGRRANPVLFDRVTFPHLMALEGDVGGRVLFAPEGPFTPAWLEWDDPRILLDVDSPQDYEQLAASLGRRAGDA